MKAAVSFATNPPASCSEEGHAGCKGATTAHEVLREKQADEPAGAVPTGLVPSAQVRQLVLLATGEYSPTLQVLQAVCAEALLKLPGKQA